MSWRRGDDNVLRWLWGNGWGTDCDLPLGLGSRSALTWRWGGNTDLCGLLDDCDSCRLLDDYDLCRLLDDCDLDWKWGTTLSWGVSR